MIGKATHSRMKILLAAVTLLATSGAMTLGQQDDRPKPAQAVSENGRPLPVPVQQDPDGVVPKNRPTPPEGYVKINFDEFGLEQLIPWIAEQTGKVVMPINMALLKNKKVTIITDRAIERARALDMVFSALRLNGVGIIENDEVIILDLIENIPKHPDLEVLEANDSVTEREDRGNQVIKVFRLEERSVEEVEEQLVEHLPDYATVTIDIESNQIIVKADIELLQRVQEIIDELDNVWIKAKTQTFRLAHADAEEIMNNILDLFESTGTSSSQSRSSQSRNQGRTPTRGQPTQPSSARSGPGPEVELRVTVNALQNTVTVTGDPEVVKEIERLILDEWDLPRKPTTKRVYPLHYTDPIVMRDTLNAVLAGGGSSSGQAPVRGPQGQTGTSLADQLAGIYSIEALPDQNALVVISKTEESLDFLDELIDAIDRPTSVGLPVVVELKHANAVELAQEINVLLAEAGAQIGLQAPDTGLTAASSAQGGDQGSSGAVQGGQQAQATQIDFPWQRGAQSEDRAPESPLIGKVRIVPIVRQNALAVLAPLAYQESMIKLIEQFDKAGRQVMISVVLAEVELTDDMAFGLRYSDGPISTALADGRLSGSFGLDVTDDPVFGGLSGSTFTANTNVNVVLQAIAAKTNVRVLQEPQVFTADNQEAIFFDGQNIPLQVSSQTTDVGTVNEQFERQNSGVTLNVRPRITAEGDVDLDVFLELSGVANTTLPGGTVLNLRQTRTHIVVKNGQTIAVSGLLRDEETVIKRGLPILRDIPIIGDIFSQHETGFKTTELIAFITPVVVEDPAENDTNYNAALRQRLQEISKPLKEQDEESTGRVRIRELDNDRSAPPVDLIDPDE